VGRRIIPERDRRLNRRYQLSLPLHYRVSQKGLPPLSGSGMTYDLSTGGIGFHCHRPLPVGAHIFLSIAWPAKHADIHPLDLLINGLVVRSRSGRTAVRVTARKLRAESVAAAPYRATA
jgi:hypothetical protein